MTQTPKPFRYTHDLYHAIERDGHELEAFVEYAVEEVGSYPSGHYGPPEHYDPGSSWVFCINPEAEADGVTVIVLTEQEIDSIHDWLVENPPVDDGEYDDY